VGFTFGLFGYICIVIYMIEDIFNTPEFKALPKKQRIWIRIKVAFFATLGAI